MGRLGGSKQGWLVAGIALLGIVGVLATARRLSPFIKDPARGGRLQLEPPANVFAIETVPEWRRRPHDSSWAKRLFGG